MQTGAEIGQSPLRGACGQNGGLLLHLNFDFKNEMMLVWNNVDCASSAWLSADRL
jgi:hypothetical protein